MADKHYTWSIIAESFECNTGAKKESGVSVIAWSLRSLNKLPYLRRWMWEKLILPHFFFFLYKYNLATGFTAKACYHINSKNTEYESCFYFLFYWQQLNHVALPSHSQHRKTSANMISQWQPIHPYLLQTTSSLCWVKQGDSSHILARQSATRRVSGVEN